MLQKVVSAIKGSIRHTIPVLLQHNSQADSRCSASAAPLASQSAIVSRFDGSGAKILTRMDFGENEIAHLQRTARIHSSDLSPPFSPPLSVVTIHPSPTQSRVRHVPSQPYGLRHPTVHCLLVSCICALLAIYTDPPGIPISQSSPRGTGHLPSMVA